MEAQDNIRQPYDEFSTTSDSDESNTPSETDEVSQQQSENSSDEELIQPVQDTEGRENQELSENIDVQLHSTNDAPDTDLIDQTMPDQTIDVDSEDRDEFFDASDHLDDQKDLMDKDLSSFIMSIEDEELHQCAVNIAISQFLWCLYSAYFTFVSPGAHLHLPALAIFPLPSLICAFVVSARYLWSFDWRKSMEYYLIEDCLGDLLTSLRDRFATSENILLIVCLYLHWIKYFYMGAASHIALAIHILDPLIYVITKISHALLAWRKWAILFRGSICSLGFATPFTQILVTPIFACSYLNLQGELVILGAIQQYTCSVAYLDIHVCPWHVILYTDEKQKLLVFVLVTSIFSLFSSAVKLLLAKCQSSRRMSTYSPYCGSRLHRHIHQQQVDEGRKLSDEPFKDLCLFDLL